MSLHEREQMIQDELINRGITDHRLIEAFREVPRHRFVDEALQEHAWKGYPVPIGEGQTLSQPYTVARSLQSLNLQIGMKVLEVGTGSGYQTALLSMLVREVYSIEYSMTLSFKARARLEDLGFRRIRYKTGDG